MSSYDHTPIFFLGAHAPGGFVSNFDSLYGMAKDYRVFILKGGPGTGKSGLIKRIANELLEDDPSVMLIPCASDPASLDGVIFPSLGVSVADGTEPHVLEPKTIGIFDSIVNVGEFLDTKKLFKQRDAILPLISANKELHARASRYITAAGSLLGDSFRIAMNCTDSEKVLRYASSLCKKEFHQSGKGKTPGREISMFLSSITPDGPVFFEESLHLLAKKIYAIEDPYGASSRMLLSAIRAVALESGYDIIACPCPMAPNDKLDHLIIPGLSLAFSTSNHYHAVSDYHQRIHARRFTETAALRGKKQHLSFNKRAVKELLSGASEILEQAREVHGEIEEYYINAMDFTGVDALTGRLVRQIREATQGQR